MSLPLSITIATLILGISLGVYLQNHDYPIPKWMSWPTEYLRNQIQHIINRVKEKNQ